ncbi:MAG: hypothetical protein J6B87_04615 [Clostridia bacterium]|nr:hypothetical protein [Clostridia bacterium]
MKNKLVWIAVIVLILFALALKLFVKDETIVEKPLDVDIGEEFTVFETENKKYVLNYTIGDVTGDSINDMVLLIGEKDNIQNTFAQNIDMVLYDSGNNEYTKIELKKVSGNNAKIELADFTGDNVSDMMAIFENEGECKIRIITVNENNLKEIFRDKDNKGLYFTVNLLDGFKANVTNRKLNINNMIDLQNEKDGYINGKIFEVSGKLIEKEIKPKTTGFINVELVKLSDYAGLKTTQRIIMKDKLNIIDEITILWKYQDGKWQIKEAIGLRQGNLLY